MESTLRKEWDLWRGNGRGSYGDVSSELLLMMRDWGISMEVLMGGSASGTNQRVEPGGCSGG
jgi:hypothetical protein